VTPYSRPSSSSCPGMFKADIGAPYHQFLVSERYSGLPKRCSSGSARVLFLLVAQTLIRAWIWHWNERLAATTYPCLPSFKFSPARTGAIIYNSRHQNILCLVATNCLIVSDKTLSCYERSRRQYRGQSGPRVPTDNSWILSLNARYSIASSFRTISV
jgi:hypothetical protein